MLLSSPLQVKMRLAKFPLIKKSRAFLLHLIILADTNETCHLGECSSSTLVYLDIYSVASLLPPPHFLEQQQPKEAWDKGCPALTGGLAGLTLQDICMVTLMLCPWENISIQQNIKWELTKIHALFKLHTVSLP